VFYAVALDNITAGVKEREHIEWSHSRLVQNETRIPSCAHGEKV
jgi:hypothetical protein